MFLKKILTIFAFFSLYLNTANAVVVKEINVSGNNFIGTDVVISKLKIKVGDDITNHTISDAIKIAYASEYFSNISVDLNEKGVLTVSVIENPIIADVYITGDTQMNADDIKKEISTKALQPYSKNKVKADADGLLSFYQRSGFLNASIEPKVVFLESNAVDVIFDIKEGDISSISKINFYGNNIFSSFRLKENLSLKEKSIIPIMPNSGALSNELLEQDKMLLKYFYNSRGFAKMNVDRVDVQFDNVKHNFVLDFYITEGDKYNFGESSIDTNIEDVKILNEIKKRIKYKTGDVYNLEKINLTLVNIVEYLSSIGYSNVQPVQVPKINEDTKTVDISYLLKVSKKAYIDKIRISGNNITRDYVILRELFIHEGDLYDKSKINLSRDRLYMLGYFKNVEIKETLIPNTDLVDLEIIVEEQMFGTANLSLGYSSYYGLNITAAVQIHNLFGMGYTGGISVDKNGISEGVSANFFNPYFFGKHNIGFGANIFASRFGSSWGATERFKNMPIKGYRYGFLFSFSFELLTRLTLGIDLGFNMNVYQKKTDYGYHLYGILMGNRKNTTIGFNLTWNKMNRARFATKGFLLQGGITFAGFGIKALGQQYVKYNLQFIDNLQIFGENLILHTELMGAIVQRTVNKNQIIGMENMYTLGGYQMRGFAFWGVGTNIARTINGGNPEYFSWAIDSLRYYYATVELRSPLFIPKDLGIYLSAFVDIGAAWGYTGPDKTYSYRAISVLPITENLSIYTPVTITETIKSTAMPRVSVGVGITWNSPMGTIGLYYAKPIIKQVYDMTMEFGIKMGTQF